MVFLTCFHSLIISGISSIAFLLFSSVAFIVRSHLWPFTFCPSPVPFTLRPFSNIRCSLNSVDFLPGGSRASTPCFFASLTSSACLRSPMTAPRHRPVSGFFHGRKGLGGAIDARVDGVVVIGSIGGSEGAEVVSETAIEGASLVPDAEGRSSGNREAVRARG